MNDTTEKSDTFDDEYVTATTMVANTMVEFEQNTGGVAQHIVIPSDLEIQSVVMLACKHVGITYELSDKANTLYCT